LADGFRSFARDIHARPLCQCPSCCSGTNARGAECRRHARPYRRPVVRSVLPFQCPLCRRDRVQHVVRPNARRAVWFAHATGAIERVTPAAQPAVPADRFAREIVRFLKVSGGALAAAERQPVRRPGSVGASPFVMGYGESRFLKPRYAGIAACRRSLCRRGTNARYAAARCAGVVRTPVMLKARYG
jgi:hypothetical protein